MTVCLVKVGACASVAQAAIGSLVVEVKRSESCSSPAITGFPSRRK